MTSILGGLGVNWKGKRSLRRPLSLPIHPPIKRGILSFSLVREKNYLVNYVRSLNLKSKVIYLKEFNKHATPTALVSGEISML
ncbi:Uncharacterised protein [Sphingobacterium daejeonense]|nr:Uncharacterised protein [Sphingobacterium daejeonense]